VLPVGRCDHGLRFMLSMGPCNGQGSGKVDHGMEAGTTLVDQVIVEFPATTRPPRINSERPLNAP